MPLFLVASLFLVVRPGAPSSVLAPSGDALCSAQLLQPSSNGLQPKSVFRLPSHTFCSVFRPFLFSMFFRLSLQLVSKHFSCSVFKPGIKVWPHDCIYTLGFRLGKPYPELCNTLIQCAKLQNKLKGVYEMSVQHKCFLTSRFVSISVAFWCKKLLW